MQLFYYPHSLKKKTSKYLLRITHFFFLLQISFFAVARGSVRLSESRNKHSLIHLGYLCKPFNSCIYLPRRRMTPSHSIGMVGGGRRGEKNKTNQGSLNRYPTRLAGSNLMFARKKEKCNWMTQGNV